MAVSRAMRRLLRVREIEEEQCQAALESALGEFAAPARSAWRRRRSASAGDAGW